MSRNADRICRDRDHALRTLNRLPDSLVHELVRRAGTRATTDGERSDGPKAKGSHSDPTLLAVVRSMARKVPDPVFDATRELAQIVSEMAQLSLRIEDKLRFLSETKERVKKAETANCEACAREVLCTPKDRLRSGLCSACYTRWLRAGKPYRMRFFVQVQQGE